MNKSDKRKLSGFKFNKTVSRLRKALNKNKVKKPIVKNAKDKTLILCPLKGYNIYRYICEDSCSYYQNKKCPKMEEMR